MAIPCENADDSQCNPNGNCTYQWGQTFEFTDAKCQVCAEGTTGRLCSKCICEDTSTCQFRRNGRCLMCQSTTFTVSISAAVTAVVILFICCIAFIAWKLPHALRRLKIILSHLANSGTLKVQICQIRKYCKHFLP